MHYELRSIGIWPLIKVSFFLNGIIGFLYGLLNAFLLSFLLSVSSAFPFPEVWVDPTDFSLGFLFIVFPVVACICAAVFLTILCVLFALIYNLIARLIGGYEFDLAAVRETATVQPVQRPITAQVSVAAPVPAPPPPPPVQQTPTPSSEPSQALTPEPPPASQTDDDRPEG